MARAALRGPVGWCSRFPWPRARVCVADVLNRVSRSFAIVIQQLGPELRDAVRDRRVAGTPREPHAPGESGLRLLPRLARPGHGGGRHEHPGGACKGARRTCGCAAHAPLARRTSRSRRCWPSTSPSTTASSRRRVAACARRRCRGRLTRDAVAGVRSGDQGALQGADDQVSAGAPLLQLHTRARASSLLTPPPRRWWTPS